MIETVIVVFVLMTLGFIVGAWISSIFYRSVIREFLKELGYDTPEKLRELHDRIADRLTADNSAALDGKPVIKIRLEQHQGIIFAYREDDQTFIGQGNTREDLLASIMHRIRGCTVEIVNGELLRENNTQTG
jgi:ferritin-like protein